MDIPAPKGLHAHRAKTDPAWGYGKIVIENKDNKEIRKIQCCFCGKTFSGGGIHRLKEHLAQKKGQVVKCSKAPMDVQYQMQNSLQEFELEKNKKRKIAEEVGDPYLSQTPTQDTNSNNSEEEEVQITSTKRKGKEVMTDPTKKGTGNFFAPRTIPGAQPSIKSVLAGKDAINNANMCVARWFYDVALAPNARNSLYWEPMLDAIAGIGPGYKGPTPTDIGGCLLKDAVLEVKQFVDGYTDIWKERGCTLMADGWTDKKGRSLINFLAYCTAGTTFIKSVDASGIVKTAQALCELFVEVVEEIGPKNVVQLVTDNAANYSLAGKKLMEKYPHIFWSPCAAHCIDLMVEEIARIRFIKCVIENARVVTKFLYNHLVVLNLMRKYTENREIVRPAVTRFATNFLTLQSLNDLRVGLRAMVVSKEWDDLSYTLTRVGVETAQIILDTQFWNNVQLVLKIMEPLVILLRIVDSDERPAMGYIYEGMNRVKESISAVFKNKRSDYRPYVDIIDARWDKQLHRSIHAAGYFLNPQFFYNKDTFSTNPEVFDGVLDCLEKMVDKETEEQIMKEIAMYRQAQGSFGRRAALSSRNSLLPTEWWCNFGGDAPNLKNVAVKILSQTCSSSGCERNWSVFERIHTNRRNKLEHKRLNDYVYVHYNLRLRQRQIARIANNDPISLDNIDLTEEWVVEKEGPAFEDMGDDTMEDWLSQEVGVRSIGDSETMPEDDGYEDLTI